MEYRHWKIFLVIIKVLLSCCFRWKIWQIYRFWRSKNNYPTLFSVVNIFWINFVQPSSREIKPRFQDVHVVLTLCNLHFCNAGTMPSIPCLLVLANFLSCDWYSHPSPYQADQWEASTVMPGWHKPLHEYHESHPRRTALIRLKRCSWKMSTFNIWLTYF